jgi:hypothetical protein
MTVIAADDTSPVSADAAGSGANIINSYGITASNFAACEHYPSGFAVYTHDVAVSTTHPMATASSSGQRTTPLRV